MMWRGARRGSARTLVLVAVLAVLWSACDSTDDDDDVSFVGDWTVTRLAINGTDLTAQVFGMASIASLDATFEADGTMEISVTGDEGPASTEGTYTVGNETIVLSSSSFAAPLELSYASPSSDTIVLTSNDAAILTELSGVDVSELPFEVDRIDITIRRV